LIHAVILAGGSGTRFWPLSRETFPKQMLNVVGENSVLQQTVKRLDGFHPPVNPVRNSSGALNPALRGGTPYGAEPGIILKSNPAAAAGPEGLWPGGSNGALFLTG
jgi:hypothetical protein